jgi:hypothetical protein
MEKNVAALLDNTTEHSTMTEYSNRSIDGIVDAVTILTNNGMGSRNGDDGGNEKLHQLKQDGGSAGESHSIASSIHTTKHLNGDSSNCSRDAQQQQVQPFTSRLGQRIWQQYQQQQLQHTTTQQYQKSQQPIGNSNDSNIDCNVNNGSSSLSLQLPSLPNNFLQFPSSSREKEKLSIRGSSSIQHVSIPSTNYITNTKTPTIITRPPRIIIIHPFAKALSKRNIIAKGDEEITVTKQLHIFTERTRQWESKLSFRIRPQQRGATDSYYTLCPILDIRDVEYSYYTSFLTEYDDNFLPPYFDYKASKSIRTYAPSTPLIGDWRSKLLLLSSSSSSSSSSNNHPITTNGGYQCNNKVPTSIESRIIHDIYNNNGGLTYLNEYNVLQDMSHTTHRQQPQHHNIIYVPLMNVRKALSVRLVNSFIDNRNRTAFTIWCYDVESGKEWYAPVRYYNDFKDLRLALINIDKSITDIPFPSSSSSSSSSSLGGGIGAWSRKPTTKEVEKSKDAHRNQLEIFLRRVFAGIYRGQLHPYLAEIAVHLQTFVGCDTISLDDDDDDDNNAEHSGGGGSTKFYLSKQVAMSETMYGKRIPNPNTEPDTTARMNLKRSIMRYVYRLFLLPVVEELVTQFVDSARGKVISSSEATIGQGNNRPRRQGNNMTNKVESSKIVEKIRDFIDQVQELILEGCREDFISISERRDFLALVDDTDNSIRDELFQEAVREQIELEIYVPLRSTISKYLVYAWFNEDMEMKHKMKALMDKPQSYFRIPKEQRSRSDWKSVSRILEEGVGRSTLPCVKLRAVVDAAKEISQLEGEERSVFPDSTFFDGTVVTKVKALGADDFLPIFIFAFVRSKIERPYALCELLSLMCDPAKTNGETGYYLATFHAALTHIHELDLTEAENDLSLIFDN